MAGQPGSTGDDSQACRMRRDVARLWLEHPIVRTRGLLGNPKAAELLKIPVVPRLGKQMLLPVLAVLVAAYLYLQLFGLPVGIGWLRDQPVLLVGAFLASLAVAAFSLWWVLRRWIREAWFFVMAGVAISGVVLSTTLMSKCAEGAGLTGFYWALLMFYGEDAGMFGSGGEGCGPLPPGIEAARFIGIGVLLWAVGGLLIRLFVSPVTRLRARLARRVIIVYGLNDASLRLVDRLVESTPHAMVLVIEPDPEHHLLSRIRASGAGAIVGDIVPDENQKRRIAVVFRRLFSKRTALERCYLMHDNDYMNVRAAAVVQQLLRELVDNGVPPRVIVRIDDVQHAKDFVRREVLDEAPAFVATLGSAQLTARALVERAVALEVERLFVVDDTDLAEAIQDEWRVVGELTQKQPGEIHLDEPDWQVTGQIAVIYTGPPDPVALRRIERRAGNLADGRVYLFAQSPDAVGVARETVLGNLFPYELSLGAFPVTGAAPADCLEGVPEDSWYRAAQALHAKYLAKYGGTAWAELSLYEIEKNFRSIWTAVHAPVKLLGRTWSASTGTALAPVKTEKELQQLVMAEHAGWLKLDLDNGFTPNDVSKSHEDFGVLKKIFRENWLLRPWDQIQREACTVADGCWRCERYEAAKGATRDSVETGREILKALGYELYRAPGPPGGSMIGVGVHGCPQVVDS